VGTAVGHARSELADRLRSRRGELEQALLARVYGVADPTETEDSVYLEGFRTAAAAAVDLALETIEKPDAGAPIPAPFLLQARLAARNGVRLDTVLRRYAAGQAILVDFTIASIERETAITSAELRTLLAASSAAFDRLLQAVGEEYAREAEVHPKARDRSKVEVVERLMAGEMVGSPHLAYPLDGWHIGLVLEGADARHPLHDLAREVDRILLLVEPRPQVLWAWLGGGRRIETRDVVRSTLSWGLDVTLAAGEPGRGVAGWRLSHKQALAVLPFAEGAPVAVARYADKGLLASIRKDQVLVESLRALYLDPLSSDREDGDVLRHTLRAYFAADSNISSAASALQVHRQTVTSRLHTVEERLGRPISQCALELNVALELAKA
jgi:hypothetical protein